MSGYLPLLLVIPATAVSVVAAIIDWRTGRVPNRITLSLLTVGLVIHAAAWPNDLPFVALALVVSFMLWRMGVMGGADAKLWMAAVAWTPPLDVNVRIALIGAALFGSAIVQMGWRHLMKLPLTGYRTPGAWRITLYFALLLFTGVTL